MNETTKKTKVFVSRHALLKGIEEYEAEIKEGYAYPGSPYMRPFRLIIGKDAHFRRSDAVLAASYT